MHHPNCDKQWKNSGQQIINQCPQKHYFLTERGVHQACRNDSNQVWMALGSSGQGYCPCFFSSFRSTRASVSNQNYAYKSESITNAQQKLITKQNAQNMSIRRQNADLQKSTKKKNVSFSLEQTRDITLNPISKIQQNNNLQNQNKKNTNGAILNSKSIQKSRQNKKTEEQKQLVVQSVKSKQKRQKFLRECIQIDKYIKGNKAYTRDMPTSAIKLLYQRPCLEAYGRKNTSGNNGFIYNDFMKTHNVLPHRLQNDPKKYQTYRSALNFCKRTKIDPQDRWRKIHRRFLKKFNFLQLAEDLAFGQIELDQENMEQLLKLNINTVAGNQFKRSKSVQNISNIQRLNIIVKADHTKTATTMDTKQMQYDRMSELKRSKSWGKRQHFFIYKYRNKEGDVQYAKDRHGLTCYVDPNFQQNKQQFAKYLKKINPIEAETVLPEDKNIDKILISNFIKHKEQDLPCHYLLPNCDQPYRAQKFSYKSRRKSMATTTNSDKL